MTLDLLTEMMIYDKHGPLDLILYGDGHEEIRKWARNRIREMPWKRLEDRLSVFAKLNLIQTPAIKDLQSLESLRGIAEDLASLIDALSDDMKEQGHLEGQEKK